MRQDSWHLGIIGGSGLGKGLMLEDAQEIAVSSPFGAPSGPVLTGHIGKLKVTFLARHGEGHRLPPGKIDYRANIDVFKRCGVTDLLAICAVGSLRETIAPGDFVLVDQFIDRTRGRSSSFFGPGLVAHVSLADPTCARISGIAAQAAREAGASVHDTACYLAMQGPQFSTRAESRLYRQWGADVIGMTAMPEARLAREAELPYAVLGMVTDWDSWRDDEAGVQAADIMAMLKRNAELARQTVRNLAGILPVVRAPSPIDLALDSAIITAPEARDPVLCARLGAVAGRVLGM